METIDCRSDTVTKPSKEMREAMAQAEVGDDVFREDPTVLKLEETMAKELGKEAGLFVPTGSMGNLISVMVHCNARGQEILLGDRSHIHVYEQGSIAQFGGVHHRTLKNLDNGTFCLDELKAKIRHEAPEDPHAPITSLVCIENTQNKCGGRAVPLQWIDQLSQLCKDFRLPLHCDGARLFNAATALKVPAARLVRDCDSVSVCLSKGLGAPVGSVIVGTKGFITQAIRVRKALGGGMRQVGVLAAAGLFALHHNVPLLQRDHDNAKRVAQTIKEHGQGIATVATVDTNLVFATISPDIMNAEQFVARMEQTSKASPDDQVSVQIMDFSHDVVRIGFHLDVTEEMTTKVCNKIKFIFSDIRRSSRIS